jgi:hypothetical protein
MFRANSDTKALDRNSKGTTIPRLGNWVGVDVAAADGRAGMCSMFEIRTCGWRRLLDHWASLHNVKDEHGAG